MSRPVIGIVANYAAPAGGIAYAKLNAGYYRSVERAGGLPLILPPTDGPAVIEQYLDAVDGVLFGGGRDLDPRRYGQAKHPATKLLAEPLDRRNQLIVLKSWGVHMVGLTEGQNAADETYKDPR